MFSQIPPDPKNANYRKHLGDEFKVKDRHLKSLQAALESRLETEADIDVFDVLNSDKKKLSALISVTSAFVRCNGCDLAGEFYNTFNEVGHLSFPSSIRSSGDGSSGGGGGRLIGHSTNRTISIVNHHHQQQQQQRLQHRQSNTL